MVSIFVELLGIDFQCRAQVQTAENEHIIQSDGWDMKLVISFHIDCLFSALDDLFYKSYTNV